MSLLAAEALPIPTARVVVGLLAIGAAPLLPGLQEWWLLTATAVAPVIGGAAYMSARTLGDAPREALKPAARATQVAMVAAAGLIAVVQAIRGGSVLRGPEEWGLLDAPGLAMLIAGAAWLGALWTGRKHDDADLLFVEVSFAAIPLFALVILAVRLVAS